MAEETDPSRELRDLRRRAEARLRDQAPDVEALSAAAARELVRELRTTQVELEIQNEELRRAQVDLATARDRYADLFERAPVGYVTLDPGGRIQEANLTFAALLRRERARLIGQPISALVADADRPAFAPAIRTRREGGGGRSTEEVRLRREGGEPFWAAIECVPAEDEGAPRIRCAVIDITGRKAAEVEQAGLEEQQRQTQRLEAVGQLAGCVAHEFNNLLSVVLGYSEILLARVHRGDPLRGYVEKILDAGKRSAALTRQLLAISRRQALNPVVLDLNDVVRGVAPMLRRFLEESVDLDLALWPDLALVKADPSQIEQVILNLAIHAREDMPQGGRVTIETADLELDEGQAGHWTGAAPGRYALLTMTNTGHGMDPVTLGQIFEPSPTTEMKGTGLGLAAVYGILRQSGGTVRAHSEPGRGATFEVLLPQAASELQPRRETSAVDDRPGRGERILVVEDEEGVRHFVEEVLRELGYEVHVAACGEDAMRLVEGQGLEPDLVLTDLTMPGIGGTALVERLRQRRPDLPVLFMSGYAGAGPAPGGHHAPRTPLLQKPFGIGDLDEAVREMLGSSRPRGTG